MCGNCGFPGHHHTQCTSETHDPQALVTVVEKGALLEGEGENGERLYGVEMDGDNDLFYGEEADEFTEGEDLVAYMAGIGLSSPAAEPMVLMMAAEQRRGRAADDGGRTERSWINSAPWLL